MSENNWVIERQEVDTEIGIQIMFRARHRTVIDYKSPYFDSYEKARAWTYHGNKDD